MKYILTLAAVLTIQQAQAQIRLLMGGTQAAVSLATLATRQKKAKATAPKTKEVAATPAPASAPARGVTPFTYQGQSIPCKRTAEAAFKGKGGPEILALEALLEQRHLALLADSAASFLAPEQLAAIVAADRAAVAARPDWNYAPYRQELAFYQKEEQRRQPAALPAPAK